MSSPRKWLKEDVRMSRGRTPSASRGRTLRAFVSQRLAEAVEEIFGAFERTIAEYEEDVCRLREENVRQRRTLTALLQPQDFQQLLVPEVEVSSVKQEWSPSLVQEEPEPTHIKEEEEELWSSQEEEQLQGVEEEAYITRFPFTPVPVKNENDEEEVQSSQLHQSQTVEEASSSTEQMKIEAVGEDCGLSQPARNLNPAANLQPTSDGEFLSSHCCETDIEDNEDKWKETSSRISTLQNDKLLNDKRSDNVEKPFTCSVCSKKFTVKGNLQTHMRGHTEPPTFELAECETTMGQVLWTSGW
ncbi:zinc finger protein 354A-like [Lampris incognitus]|uniref:zinc finger protein 354A-like n=1 Tax=Lampris incognitus TaxID=2546036 RepID=UPI0024B61EE9|nr:zinc finger protein 354A-like [Lampris incognitus]